LTKSHHTHLIKSEATRLGFSFCGISKADFLEAEAPILEQWLEQGRHGRMSYMENYFEMRLDPRKLVPGAKSVISLLLNYYPENEQNTESDSYNISKYAYGKDYHKVIKAKLKELYEFINSEIGEIGGRVFVDSAPVMDKAWAKKSGLGWMGKNTNIINPKEGSFFFIAELIIDLELEYDGPMKDYCGSCTRCIDACPTDALIAPYQIDASKCISYFTIELRENIPDEYHNKLGNWIFGCDVCQDVCPWNRFSKPNHEPEFSPTNHILEMNKSEWDEITEDVFVKLFKDSPLKRTGFEGMKRNITVNNS
jgi:epoxyqueuosine reductase